MVRSHACLLGLGLVFLIAAPACDDDENPTRPTNRDTRLEWPVDGAHPVSDAPRADRIDDRPGTDAHDEDAAAPHDGGDGHAVEAGLHDHPGDAHGVADSPLNEAGADAASDQAHENTGDAPQPPDLEDGGDAESADVG